MVEAVKNATSINDVFQFIGGLKTRYVTSATEEVAELDGNRVVTKRFIAGPAIDERIAQIDANNAVKYIHGDRQNSVIALTNATGNPILRRAYGEYGETDATQMAQEGHPFGYTGRRWFTDLGLYYYRARWYDPELGTFLETDPIGSLDYINLYSYVGLNPLNATDPTGMAPNKDGATDYMYIASTIDSDLDSLAENSGNVGRYFYTETYGWVDVRHFGTAANKTIGGMPGIVVEGLGVGVEVSQKVNEGKGDYRSGFSPEDLPSNSAGVNFANFYNKEKKKGSKLSMKSAFKAWARRSGAKTFGQSGFIDAFEVLPQTDPSKPANGQKGSNASSDPNGTGSSDSNGGSGQSTSKRCKPSGSQC